MKKIGLAVLLLGLVGAVASVPASATSVLYDNTTAASGTVTGWNISRGVVTDSFTLTQTSTITGADFNVWLYSGDSLSSVDWSISNFAFGGSPATASILSETSVGSAYGLSVDEETISIPSVTLAAGTYYLTLQNAVTGLGTPPYWDESDGSSLAFDGDAGVIGSETFQILGAAPSSVTPEPSSFLLLGSGLAGFAGMIRRKLKA